MHKLKLCLISSHGGHFRELLAATQSLGGAKYYVTARTRHTADILHDRRRYFIVDPHTSAVKYLINAVQAVRHLIHERPRVVISTGAGITLPTMLIAKYLLRAQIIFIESAANVITPSRTGRCIYPHADLFLVQWPEIQQYYPDSKYVGLVL